MIGKYALLVCTAASALAAGSQAMAADAVEASPLEEIVVTARRVNERLQDVPIAVTAFTDTQVRQEGVKNVADLRGRVPALFVTTGSGGTSTVNLTIRGQSNAGTLLINPTTVGAYFNSVPFPRAIGLRQAMYDVSAVQVLKGPQGTLFGKNTTGGALLINTKIPSLDEVGGYAEIAGGNYDYVEFRGAVSAPIIADKLAVRLAVDKSRRSGFGDSNGSETGNENFEAARLSVLFEPTDSIQLLISADTLRTRAGGAVTKVTGGLVPLGAGGTLSATQQAMFAGVARELGLANPTSAASIALARDTVQAMWNNPDAYSNNSRTTYGHLDLSGVSADLTVDFSDGLTFRSISGYRETNRDDLQDYDATPFTILNPQLVQESNFFSQEVQLLNDPAERFSWIVGAYYSEEEGTGGSKTFQLGNTAAAVADYDVLNQSRAVFGQVNYSLMDTVRVTAGARYTEEKMKIFNRTRTERPLGTFLSCSLAPRLNTAPPCGAPGRTESSQPTYLLSVDWKPQDDFLLYGKVSTAFQAGGVNIQATSNLPFGPEKATVFEAGFKGDFLDGRLRANAAIFHTDYKDIQRTSVVLDQGSLVTVTTNAARARLVGGEVELLGRPIEPLTLRASASVVDFKYKEFIDAGTSLDRSDEALGVPRTQYNASATYVLPTSVGDLSLHTSYRYQSKAIFQPTALLREAVSQDGYGLWDARASISLPSDVDVSLFVKNVTNKTYQTTALSFDSSFGYDLGFVGDPRTYGIEIRKTFGGG